MDLRLTLAQTNPALGDFHKNLDDHLRQIRAATAEGADLILLPELSLTGYFLKDQVFDLGIDPEGPELEPLRNLSLGISIVAGFVERTPDGRFYNCLGFFEDGKLLAKHRKVHLVSYGMFDETRDFAAGDEWGVVDSRLGRFGLFLCEDIWHLEGQYLRILESVDAFLVASAGPGRGVGPDGPGTHSDLEGQGNLYPGGQAHEFESVGTWRSILTAAALHAQCYVAWANRVGFEDGVAFSGGSALHGPSGEQLAHLAGLDEGNITCRLTSDVLLRSRQRTPLLRDSKPWVLAKALGVLAPVAPSQDCAPPAAPAPDAD
jgi:NAD+ synthase (glutamine-hydrolysing)